MALGCAAKLSAAPLPLVWLALHATRWSRPAPLRGTLAPVLALLAGVAAVLLWRIHLLGDVSPYAGERVYANVAGRSATWAASLQIHLLYLQQMLIPIGLGPEYADRGASWSAPATIVAASAWLSLAIWALVCALRGRHRLATAVIFGALLLALPTSNIWGMPNMRADRFMYLPSALVCLGAAAFLDRAGRSLARRFGHPWLEVAPLVLAVVVQGAAAQGAAAAYRNDSVLWRTALVHAPDSARAHSVYGELLAARLQLDELARQSPTLRARAHAHCQIALELEPSSALPHLCAARLASAERRWNDAYRSFQRALQRGPQRGDRVMVALASTVMDVTEFPYHDRIERAFAHIEQAHAEYPYSPEPPIVAAALQHRLGRADLAKKWLATASTLAPERWDIVTRGVELDLDLGHPLAASTAWNTHQSTLRHAHPEQLAGLRRRLDRARRTWTPSPFSEPILLERTNEP
jgi:tetratricopeptide (TPR) repeat protein